MPAKRLNDSINTKLIKQLDEEKEKQKQKKEEEKINK
jgi:alpha-D-ribose 1-methylphosphonate 5-triphosphate synthase subunit PhnG